VAAGRGPTYATPDSDCAAAARQGDDSGNAEHNTSTGGSRNAGIAPTGGYSGSAERARGENEFKPHNNNITEGGFDSNAPNAGFNQDIGTEKDPGRLAEQNLEARNAQSARDSVSGPSGVTGKGTYDALRSEERV